MTNPREILAQARSILLVDWPDPSVPRALLKAGLNVFGYSPHRCYSRAEIAPAPPQDLDAGGVFPPRNDDETGYLVFRRLPGRPAGVDIVGVYRPAEELPGILAEHVLPLGARVVWLLRPVASTQERDLVRAHKLLVIEGNDLSAYLPVPIAIERRKWCRP